MVWTLSHKKKSFQKLSCASRPLHLQPWVPSELVSTTIMINCHFDDFCERGRFMKPQLWKNKTVQKKQKGYLEHEHLNKRRQQLLLREKKQGTLPDVKFLSFPSIRYYKTIFLSSLLNIISQSLSFHFLFPKFPLLAKKQQVGWSN